jgi:glutathione S-transferase
MKLLVSAASPYVRKVRVLIRELDIVDEITEQAVATTAFNSDASVVAANPMGKIPALIRNDAPTLYDSRVITRFLNDTNEGGFYPAARIWETLTLEATGDGIMDTTVSMAYEVRLRPETEQSPDWVEAQWQKASRGIKAVNDRWMSHLSGPLDMSHIAIACALSYVDLRHDIRNWRDGNEALATWHANFEMRDSMQATKGA